MKDIPINAIGSNTPNAIVSKIKSTTDLPFT